MNPVRIPLIIFDRLPANNYPGGVLTIVCGLFQGYTKKLRHMGEELRSLI